MRNPNTGKMVRLLTYNVHSCIGTDRKLDPPRVAAVIARARPDIVALQEVDVGRTRTGGVDQAKTIASLLQMQSHFHATLNVAEERYGDAIITALPTGSVKAGPLPSIGEPRGALGVEIILGEEKLLVVNTHLGLRGRERIEQMNALLGAGWLGDHQGPAVLCGDFNAVPASAAYRAASRHMVDVQLSGASGSRATFPSRYPLLRLDHIFVTRDILASKTQVLADRATRLASDHLPLLATLTVGA